MTQTCSTHPILLWTATLSLLAAISGCRGPVHDMPIFARSTTQRPALVGRSVGILPPMTVGPETGPAVLTTRAAKRIFSGEIAGVQFSGIESSVARLQEDPEAFYAIRQAVTSGFPARFGPKGKSRTLVDSRSIGGVERRARQRVTLRESSKDVSAVGPDQLDPEWLRSFDTDYVLVSIPFASYFKRKEYLALYGILPYSGFVRLRQFTPRAVFMLYDVRTGRKVWESQIGSLSVVRALGPDRRSLPILGAAYLLTGDIETPLSRLLEVSPQPN